MTSDGNKTGLQADLDWLENGWNWLVANPSHPRHRIFEDEWIRRLRMYEEAWRMTYG